MSYLEINGLAKSFPTPQGPALVVKDFTLQVNQGEFICIIGHSGCGKSTVLSIVMGLAKQTGGGISIAGKAVNGPGTDRGVVFQAPSLFPWLTAIDNVRLAVDQVRPKESLDQRLQAAHRALERAGLLDAADRYPDELSAGMKQRVGIARAFALEPAALLLDEPFSLLDAFSRMELQDELMDLWEKERKTVLMVTHDVDEALLLADRIVMMTRGPEATIGGILSVPFERPRNRVKVLEHPLYYELRDQLMGFLEERPSASPFPVPQEIPEAEWKAGRVVMVPALDIL